MKNQLTLLVAIFACAGIGIRPACAAVEMTVKGFGALGNGVHDDTAAIQAAIDALENRGGGTLHVPRGTYLLNSYRPSPHPWFFYNLRAGSNIAIKGESGAKFLQGPNGRATMASIPGATSVMTSVLVFGSPNFVINTFQDAKYNGGFSSLRATHADERSVTLSTPSDVSKFRVGDYVALYAFDPAGKDVVPSESSQVTSVRPDGRLGLKYPLARAFEAPLIAKVTSLATVNVSVSNMILQGCVPLNVNEVFGFTATGNTFLSDTSVGGGNEVGPVMNDLRGVRFTHNTVASTGPSVAQLELPQRNSKDLVIDSNTFDVSVIGFGEYGAHWSITGNTIHVHPEHLKSGAAVFFGGYDVLFAHNKVQGNTTAIPLVADWLGPVEYDAYVGKIRIVDNVFVGEVDGTNCLNIVGRDTAVTGNHFNIVGKPGEVILVEGPLPQAIHIAGNTLSMHSGFGIVLNSPGTDNSVVSRNTITGAGSVGIYVTSPPKPNPGKHILSGNMVSGFRTAISIDRSKHPGAVGSDLPTR